MLERRNLNYFTHPAFLRLDAEAGVLRSRGGTRIVGVTEDLLRGLLGACERVAGDGAARILRRCGAAFGARLGRRFEAELAQYSGLSVRDRPMGEFDALLTDLWHGAGLGHLAVDWAHAQSGHIPLRLEDSPLLALGTGATEELAAGLVSGFLEGFIGHFAEPGLRCVKTGSQTEGGAGTTFVLAFEEDAARVETLLSQGLPHAQIVARLGEP